MQRPVEELKEELAAIGRQYSELPPSTFVWNKAIIGESDHIFPPKNQEQAWQKYCNEIQRYDGYGFVTGLLLIFVAPGMFMNFLS